MAASVFNKACQVMPPLGKKKKKMYPDKKKKGGFETLAVGYPSPGGCGPVRIEAMASIT